MTPRTACRVGGQHERGVMTSTQRERRRSKPTRSPVASRTCNPERIRWSRVMAAQARAASGYYDRDEVREFLVEALLEELRRQ